MGAIESLATWVDTIRQHLRSRSAVRSDVFNSRSDVGYVRLPQGIIRYRVSGNGVQTLVLRTGCPPLYPTGRSTNRRQLSRPVGFSASIVT
jgi:hypothetical protein